MPVRITRKDIRWLKQRHIVWEPHSEEEEEDEHQLMLDFCEVQGAVREPLCLEEAQMKKECASCHGTGKCQVCKGTGRFGYPGVGREDLYRTTCGTCQGSGDCRTCQGTGQR